MKAPATPRGPTKPPLHQLLDSIPPQYVAMAAAQMSRLNQSPLTSTSAPSNAPTAL